MKFKICFLLSVFTTLSTSATIFAQKQQSFTVQFTYDSTVSGKAYLIYYSDVLKKAIRDSTDVKNNRCVFRGKIVHGSIGFIKLSRGNGIDNTACEFVIEKGDFEIVISTRAAQFYLLNATNSKTNSSYAKLIKDRKLVEERRLNLVQKLEVRDSVSMNLKTSQINVLAKQEKYKLDVKFISSNINSYASLYILTNNLPRIGVDTLESIYNKLSTAYQKSLYGELVRERLDYLKRTKVIKGAKAIDFVATDSNGKPIKLSDFSGKNIVIDFWATWCKPCLEQFSNLRKVLQSHNDSNLVIITIASETDKHSVWLDLIHKFDLQSHINIRDSQQAEYNGRMIRYLYDIELLPTTYFINSKLEVVEVTTGMQSFERLSTQLKKLAKS